MCENLVLKFKVESFRKIPNPYLKSEYGEKEAMMYIAICDVKDLPDNIPMETNPREQRLQSGVSKKIRQSLLDPTELDFFLLNRGLVLSAKEVSFNNYSNEVTIVFEDFDIHGNVDGGHTYKIILNNRDKLDPGQQYVKIEILTGVENIFQKLAAARNTSVQVKDQSIAELEDRFDIIKNVIADEPFKDRVFFKENDEGDIDVSDILAILNLFNIDRYPNMESFPKESYTSKKKCIDNYINDHKDYGETVDNPYVKMVPIMKDIFRLYDVIETNMSNYYRQKNPNGRYGAVKGVSIPKNGETIYSKYYNTPMDASTPNGFLYPILGSLRALVIEEDGKYRWIKNPYQVIDKVGKDLVETTIERSRSLGNNPQSVGKDSGNWKTLYMTVKFELLN